VARRSDEDAATHFGVSPDLLKWRIPMTGIDYQLAAAGEIDKALAVENGPVSVNVHINGDVELPVSWEFARHLKNTGE
jgi:hypothetical protein